MSESALNLHTLARREEHQLEILERVRAQISEAKSIEDVLELRDQTSALQAYARKKRLNEESMRELNGLQIRVQRRLGELTAAMQRSKAGRKPAGNESARPTDSTKAEALATLGLTKQDASVCERLAAIPEKRFDAEVARAEVTLKSLVRIGDEYRSSARAPRRRQPRTPTDTDLNVAADSAGEALRRVVDRWPAGVSYGALVSTVAQILADLRRRETERRGNALDAQASGLTPTHQPDAPPTEPQVSDRVLAERAKMFRLRVEKLTKPYVRRMPTGRATALLANALRLVADEIEGAARRSASA